MTILFSTFIPYLSDLTEPTITAIFANRHKIKNRIKDFFNVYREEIHRIHIIEWMLEELENEQELLARHRIRKRHS